MAMSRWQAWSRSISRRLSCPGWRAMTGSEAEAPTAGRARGREGGSEVGKVGSRIVPSIPGVVDWLPLGVSE